MKVSAPSLNKPRCFAFPPQISLIFSNQFSKEACDCMLSNIIISQISLKETETETETETRKAILNTNPSKMIRSKILHSLAFVVWSSWSLQDSPLFVRAEDDNVSQRVRTGNQRIRGATPLQLQENTIITQNELPDEEMLEASRRLQAASKGCVSKLSGSRGGSNGAAKCSTGSSTATGSGGGPQIATQCSQVTSRHRLLGDGQVSTANNFGGDILDPPCDRNFFGRGTWWNYVGTGERVMVSTCHTSTNISTALFLYQSPDLTCDALDCMARSNLNQCGDGGMDAFFAAMNVVYYISILGDNGNNRNIPGPEGSMGISFTRQANGCTPRVPTLDGRGTVTAATIDDGSALLGPQCNTNLNGRGLWYQFEGTGENVLISTCHNKTSIPTAISVYDTEEARMACSGLTCQAFAPTSEDCLDANGQSKGSVIRVPATDGLTHYVSIVGDNENNNSVHPPGPQGDIGVSMLREFNGCDRDIAPSLRDDGSIVTASNVQAMGAPLLGPQCDHNHNGHGRWYQFMGKGEPVLISTCHSSTTIPTAVSVYEAGDAGGSCQGSTCQAFEDSNQCEGGNGSILLLSNTTKDKTHFLSVIGNNGNRLYPPGPEGQIGLTIVTRSNGCNVATPMFDDGRLDIVNTADGLWLGPQCEEQYNGRGYWYQFLGEGREVVASTCHTQTNISTVISVYESSEGGCENELSCVTIDTNSECESGQGGSARFVAEAGVLYKISVLGDNGNTLFPAAPDGQIAFSLATADLSCPCWSHTELASATPDTMNGGYIAQSCNTLITEDQSANIQLVNGMGMGASMTRVGGTENRVECSMAGLIGRTIADLEYEDQIELCLGMLYDRCTELASSATSVERTNATTALDVEFANKCTPQDFYDTILVSQVGAVYENCLNVTTVQPTSSPTMAPSPSPSISCPCWTADELEAATPTSFEFTDNSCNTEITGDLSISSDPTHRASIRVVDGSGLGARMVRLGADEDQTICTMAGAATRSVLSLSHEDIDACLILLYNRCEELSEEAAVAASFSEQCSIWDFTDTIIASEDGAAYENCLGVSSTASNDGV